MPQVVRVLVGLFLTGTLVFLTACGGDGGGDQGDTSAVLAPTITVQPVDVQVTQDAAAQFSVTASGTDLAYQWQRSADGGATWTTISGATAASLNLAIVTTADSGASFRVVVSRSGALTTSSAVTLTVVAVALAPSITVQPVAQQATAGGTVTFAVTAAGTALGYQWQTSSDGNTWTDVAGATQPTLQLTGVTFSANGLLYRVLLRNSSATLASDAVVLTVLPATPSPAFGAQPTSTTVTAPSAATFSVTVSGDPAPTLQWQRSSDNGATYSDIAGATQASYTLAATALADNGLLLRVLASNSAGKTLSNPATLGVSAALAAPAIVQEPQDLSVGAGQSAAWTVAVSGNPQPGLQWQVSVDAGATWSNVNGATAASYSLVASAADNGKRVRVLASNSQGTVQSRAAVLTVVAAGVLQGRDWATAQSLEENSTGTLVLDQSAAIDDAGRVTVVFRKSDGSREVLYATRGTPNGAGVAPTWTAPVPIDLLGGVPVSYRPAGGELSVTAAPGGDVVALWNHSAACTATAYGTAPFLCRYYYHARYRVATGNWDAPELVTDTPDGAFTTLFNDRGDLVFFGNSWVPFGTQRATAVKALFMKTATETGFRRQPLSNEPTSVFAKLQLDMDGDGQLLLATQFIQSGTADIMAFRGTAAAGLGSALQLDSLPEAAVLQHTRLGLHGQQVVVWSHPDKSNNYYAAASASAGGAFTVSEFGMPSAVNLSVSDAGVAMLCSPGCRNRRLWTAATGWGATEFTNSAAISIGTGLDSTGFSRNGDLLWVDGVGVTGAYDAVLNVSTIQSFNTATLRHVLGLANGSAGYAKPLLSVSGVGVVPMRNNYNVLPTPAAPAGVSRTVNGSSDTTALWAAFFK